MISIDATIKMSFRALRVNKMRSALTMLGIVIGVSAVITMIAVGTGASVRISQQISSIGSNLIMIMPGTITTSGVRLGGGTQQTLTIEDAKAIQNECSAVAAAAPMFNRGAQVVYGNQNWATQIVGTTQEFLTVRDWPLDEGRAFTDQEVRSASKVCLIGHTVAENLFGSESPLGKIIRIRSVPFVVVGLMSAKGQSPMGQDQDDTIVVPITTAQKRLFGTRLPGMAGIIMVKAQSEEALSDAQRQITGLLHQRHRIGPKQEDDFTVRNLTQVMEAAQQSSRVMALLLGIVASVSLVVGGIGIMNIMLVSVTERTREIGIRMAIGAKTWDIRLQFLIEAMFLSIFGGIVGIVLGSVASKVLSVITGWPTTISISSVLLSFGFSAFVGIFFGYYPAYKASLLNPIEALRYE